GEIYHFRFKASMVPQKTLIRVTKVQFYNGGIRVNPDSSSDALIGIGLTLDVPQPATPPAGPRLLVAPNPARTGMSLMVETSHDGKQQLSILDAQGRVIRHLPGGVFAAGRRLVTWDRTTDSGAPAAPGVYFAVLRASGKTIRTRFTVLN